MLRCASHTALYSSGVSLARTKLARVCIDYPDCVCFFFLSRPQQQDSAANVRVQILSRVSLFRVIIARASSLRRRNTWCAAAFCLWIDFTKRSETREREREKEKRSQRHTRESFFFLFMCIVNEHTRRRRRSPLEAGESLLLASRRVFPWRGTQTVRKYALAICSTKNSELTDRQTLVHKQRLWKKILEKLANTFVINEAIDRISRTSRKFASEEMCVTEISVSLENRVVSPECSASHDTSI